MKISPNFTLLAATAVLLASTSVSAQVCGSQMNGRTCDNGECCSRWGYCGVGSSFCCVKYGCQNGCWGDAECAFMKSSVTVVPGSNQGMGHDESAHKSTIAFILDKSGGTSKLSIERLRPPMSAWK